MTYQLDIARRAERDRDDAYAWYAENYSKQYADEWYFGLAAAIRSLAENPERHALIRENSLLSKEVRGLNYKKAKRQQHRILYTIEGNTVYVLRIRHSAQKDVAETDLGEPNR